MTSLPPPLAPRQWLAELRLHLSYQAGRTSLVRAHHHGPLRIQKALYPEGPRSAELMIIHPPGGVAGGDQLKLDLSLDSQAQALVTTPGAAKWYRSNGAQAGQTIHLKLAADSVLEWLPQESIYFSGTDMVQRLRLDCAASARACAWDITVLGRRASGERFDRGVLRQHLELYRDGELLWAERAVIRGADPLGPALVGWRGQHVAGCLWAIGLPQDESLRSACRAISVAGVSLGVTQLDNGLLLVRALGSEAEPVRAALQQAWASLRPALCGRAAVAPRIWAT